MTASLGILDTDFECSFISQRVLPQRTHRGAAAASSVSIDAEDLGEFIFKPGSLGTSLNFRRALQKTDLSLSFTGISVIPGSVEYQTNSEYSGFIPGFSSLQWFIPTEPQQAVREKLARLQDAFADDYASELSAESVKGFMSFYSSLSNPRVPSLSAESTGLIVATWRIGMQSASLKFINEEQLQYALALETPKGISRPWGTSDVRSFFATQPLAQAVIELSA